MGGQPAPDDQSSGRRPSQLGTLNLQSLGYSTLDFHDTVLGVKSPSKGVSTSTTLPSVFNSAMRQGTPDIPPVPQTALLSQDFDCSPEQLRAEFSPREPVGRSDPESSPSAMQASLVFRERMSAPHTGNIPRIVGLNWSEPPACFSTDLSILKLEISNSMCKSIFGKNFMPRDTLGTVFTKSLVHKLLQQAHKCFSLTEFVSLSEKITNSYCKILAILVLMDRVDAITRFIAWGLDDRSLPFAARECGRTREVELYCKQDLTLPCYGCGGWDKCGVLTFEKLQWSLSPPHFAMGRRGGAQFYDLSDRDVLPFIEAEDERNHICSGGTSTIRRVRLHPAHYDFGAEVGPSFALKVLRSKSQRDFEHEYGALKIVNSTGSAEVVELLTAFKYKSKYYLLFPWADGDLSTFWRRHTWNCLDFSSLRWILKQCASIARGLSIVHNPTTSSPTHTKLRRNTAAKGIFGIHGDIKPQNILYFNDPSLSSFGIFKIADFGLSQFHPQTSSSQSPVQLKRSKLGYTPTYRAPECDMPGTRISSSYDIWSLGCVFLEFITWAIAGSSAVTEFARRRETKTPRGESCYAFFGIKRNMRTGSAVPFVKHSVKNWISTLRWSCEGRESLSEFLDFIETRMLVPDCVGDNHRRPRASSEETYKKLVELCDYLEHGH